MISQLRIKNFKSHKDTNVKLGLLTVLTGVNGCGKTSLIQSLLLLRQTFLKSRLSNGLDLNSPLCSIGIAHDALYALADDSKISFRIDSDNQQSFNFVFDAGDGLLDSFIKKYEYNCKNCGRVSYRNSNCLNSCPYCGRYFGYSPTGVVLIDYNYVNGANWRSVQSRDT